jgi:hypothetical protein
LQAVLKEFGAGGTWDHNLPQKIIDAQPYGTAAETLTGRIPGFDRMILSGLANKELLYGYQLFMD